MSIIFIIDSAVKAESQISNSLLILFKQNMTLKNMEIESNAPNIIQRKFQGSLDSQILQLRDIELRYKWIVHFEILAWKRNKLFDHLIILRLLLRIGLLKNQFRMLGLLH